MRTLIRNARVFDGERTLDRADVLIVDDRIAPPDDRDIDVEVDATGRTLLPGLINAHTHTFDGSLAQALAHGVTTELDMFCLPGSCTGREWRCWPAPTPTRSRRSTARPCTASWPCWSRRA